MARMAYDATDLRPPMTRPERALLLLAFGLAFAAWILTVTAWLTR